MADNEDEFCRVVIEKETSELLHAEEYQTLEAIIKDIEEAKEWKDKFILNFIVNPAFIFCNIEAIKGRGFFRDFLAKYKWEICVTAHMNEELYTQFVTKIKEKYNELKIANSNGNDRPAVSVH